MLLYYFSIMLLYRMSLKFDITHPEQVERIKLSRKVLYHFAIFAMVNEILITKRL